MSRFNPGPWQCQVGGGRNGSLITIRDAKGVRVASVLRQYGDNGTSAPPYDDYRRLCNADLIAAAPVMLKAITDFLAIFNDREGILRKALFAALGEHGPDRTCECQECFDYFWAPPPPCSRISATDGRS